MARSEESAILTVLTVIALVVVGCSSQPVVPTQPGSSVAATPAATGTPTAAPSLKVERSPTEVPSPQSTPSAFPSPLPTGTLGHSNDPSQVLLRLTDTKCHAWYCDPTVVVFALYGDGRAFFRSDDAGVAGKPQVVQLDEAEVQTLLAFAIDEGDLRTAPEGFIAWSAVSYTTFEIRSSALYRQVEYGNDLSLLLAGAPPASPGLQRLAARLANFASEVAGAAIPLPSCSASQLHTIQRNDVVAWDKPAWQRATPNVWASPLGAFDPGSRKVNLAGFSSVYRTKVLWWVPLGEGHPLVVTATPVNGGGFEATFTINADHAQPNRPDRPSGLGPLPPGCYRFSVSIGGESGSFVDEVRL